MDLNVDERLHALMQYEKDLETREEKLFKDSLELNAQLLKYMEFVEKMTIQQRKDLLQHHQTTTTTTATTTTVAYETHLHPSSSQGAAVVVVPTSKTILNTPSLAPDVAYNVEEQEDHKQPGGVDEEWEEVEVLEKDQILQHVAANASNQHQKPRHKININSELVSEEWTGSPQDYYSIITQHIDLLVDNNGTKIRRNSKKSGNPTFVLFLYYIFRPKIFYTEQWGESARPIFTNTSQIKQYCFTYRKQMLDFYEYLYTKGRCQMCKWTKQNTISSRRNLIRRFSGCILF